MRGDEIQRLAGLERLFDERVELWMRQLRHDLDTHLRLSFERRDGFVQRVVHRPADEGRSNGHFPALHPPSIISADPVTNDDSSLAR